MIVIDDLEDRPHVRLLASLIIEDNPIMKAQWFNHAYDGDDRNNDRAVWYTAMDGLVARGLVERIIRTFGSAAEWHYFKITAVGENTLVRIMDLSDEYEITTRLKGQSTSSETETTNADRS